MNIIKLSAIGSTNDYLKDISNKMTLEDATVVVAEHQTMGRGQMGAGWYSKPGESLSFSVFKRLSCVSTADQFVVNFGVALAAKNALADLGLRDLSIKWPNDILAGSKKIGGILIENRIQQDRIVSTVVGIGLNVNNQVLENLPRASSLFLASGKVYDREEVMKLIVAQIIKRLDAINSNSFGLFQEEFENAMFRKDLISVFENREGIRFNAMVRGVSSSGELILELEDEVVQKFQLKELKMLF